MAFKSYRLTDRQTRLKLYHAALRVVKNHLELILSHTSRKDIKQKQNTIVN